MLEEIRTVREDIPIIFISGYSEESAMADVESDSYQGFLKKPFTSDMLLEKLRDILGG